jgi:hypothetical protein
MRVRALCLAYIIIATSFDFIVPTQQNILSKQQELNKLILFYISKSRSFKAKI